MSVGMRVTITGLESLTRKLDVLRNLDLAPMLDAVGTELSTQTKLRIEDEKAAPDGTPWKPWSDKYAATRRPQHSLLISDEYLLLSLKQLISGNELSYGSNMEYAAAHQFGYEPQNLPARPYLGMNAENMTDIAEVIRIHLEAALR